MLSNVIDANKGEAIYTYNGMGKRVATQNPTERIDYLLDLTKDYHNMLERSVNGETESYIYDSNVVSMSKSGNDYFYMLDELGTGMYLTGTDGFATSTYAYDEFGRNLNPFTGKREKPAYTKQGNILQPLAFTGYQHDEMTDSYFAQARYYNPVFGRFISKDRARYILKSMPKTQNIYAYCGNNSIINVDLDGHESIVVSGGYGISEGYNYEFIETAIKDMRDQISNGTNPEDITWVVADAGYDKPSDISNFEDTADKLGVNIVVINNSTEFVNYINTKDARGDVNERLSDKITDMSFYCHGLSQRYSPGADTNHLSFGHDCGNVEEKFIFNQSDISKLNDNAFNHTVTYFFSCNSGTKDSDGNSFAQTWTNKTKGESLGLVNGRTYYGAINSTGSIFMYTGELGKLGFTPSDVYNGLMDRFGQPTSDQWKEKQKRKKDRLNNGKGYSDYGSLNYPRMVSWAGDLNVLFSTGVIDRGWKKFTPNEDCEG